MSAPALSVAFRLLVVVAVGLGYILLSQILGSDSHSTQAGDPLFGDGCRYVAVDTPTPVQPHVTVCRPIAL